MPGRPPRLPACLLAALAVAVGILGGCSSATEMSAAGAGTATADPPTPATASLPGTDVTGPSDGAGDLRLVDFHSQALGATDSYLVYLPPDYERLASSGTRFSVLYMLHGDGNHGSQAASHLFERGGVGPAASAMFASGRLEPMLIVVPNLSGPDSDGDTEWANTSRGPFASALIDLVNSVDATWPTVSDRSGRGISGLSMGGYGAVNVALRNLSLFSTVESWSGYFNQTRTGPYVGASRRLIRSTSPAVYVRKLRTQLRANPIHVLLYVSAADPFHVEQAPFARSLSSLGVQVTTKLFGGRHNFQLWASHMPLALSFAGRWLTPPRGS